MIDECLYDESKNVRALKIMTKHEPWFFFLYTAKSLLEALAPYAAIFFSARLIDELAGDRDPRMLFTWTLAILLSEVIISIFSVVFQDFNLFSRPLDENVAGSIMPDEERVIKCLNDAGFVLDKVKMTKGLKTWLYKNLDKEGVEISGGEAQKIAIARALYKDAPFIILDEPTAALDPIAEAEIYEKFNDIVGDKTAVYISHRLSSCKFCDEIAVFHEGTVIQKGSHEELLRDTKGKYFELWNAQAQYYDRKSA